MRNALQLSKKMMVLATLLFTSGLFLWSAVASAQTAGVTVTPSNSSGTITAGSNGQHVATFTLNYTQSGAVYVYDIPFSVTANGGANINQLSSCQVFDAGNVAVGNLSTLNSGNNTIALNSGVRVMNGTPTTLTLRCNVSSATPSGGSFQFGVFNTGTTNPPATTTPPTTGSPMLSVSTQPITVMPIIQPGTQDTVLANLTLDARQSSSDIQVSSLPLAITTGSGAFTSDLSDCRVRNAGTGAILTNGANVPGAIVTGANTLRLDTPLTVPRGGTVTLSITCDVSGTIIRGGTILTTFTPSAIPANVSGSSASVTPTAGASTAGTLVMIAQLPTTPTTPTTPGVPNTGAGGNAVALGILLALSLGAVVFGARNLRKHA